MSRANLIREKLFSPVGLHAVGFGVLAVMTIQMTIQMTKTKSKSRPPTRPRGAFLQESEATSLLTTQGV